MKSNQKKKSWSDRPVEFLFPNRRFDSTQYSTLHYMIQVEHCKSINNPMHLPPNLRLFPSK